MPERIDLEFPCSRDGCDTIYNTWVDSARQAQAVRDTHAEQPWLCREHRTADRLHAGMVTAVELLELLRQHSAAATPDNAEKYARFAGDVLGDADPEPTMFALASVALTLAEVHGENLPGLLDSLRSVTPAVPNGLEFADEDSIR